MIGHLGKWGELQFATFSQRLKPGDVKMMKQLAEWCDKNQNGFIPPAQRLAEEMDEECNGKVTNISYPKLDHFLQESVTFPKFLPFFDEHTNDIEPDFDIIRAAAKKWLK